MGRGLSSTNYRHHVRIGLRGGIQVVSLYLMYLCVNEDVCGNFGYVTPRSDPTNHQLPWELELVQIEGLGRKQKDDSQRTSQGRKIYVGEHSTRRCCRDRFRLHEKSMMKRLLIVGVRWRVR